MTSDIAVIDYGVGNLMSVSRGLEHCGAKVTVTPDPEVILAAGRVILPGVGAFADAMAALHERDLVEVVQEVARKGTPLLGICLGMEMLLDESEEFGITTGLGLIPGRVVPVPAVSPRGTSLKIPHIGWSPLVLPESRNSWEESLLDGISPGHAVYFVHSFMASPDASSDRLADTVYGGVPISAVIARDNVFGCQFHPEKSGPVGLRILANFLEL